jgi:hypothetical protein
LKKTFVRGFGKSGSSLFLIGFSVALFSLTAPTVPSFAHLHRLSFDVAAAQESSTNNQNYTIRYGLGELTSAYSQVNRAEGLGASANQVSSWTTHLNESAFLLQEAALPSNANNSVALIQESVIQSQYVYSSAEQIANSYSLWYDVVLIAAYGLVLPSSYNLSLLTNWLYEWNVRREERIFFRRAIRRKKSQSSDFELGSKK